jgi:hypothetical protein
MDCFLLYYIFFDRPRTLLYSTSCRPPPSCRGADASRLGWTSAAAPPPALLAPPGPPLHKTTGGFKGTVLLMKKRQEFKGRV